MFGFALVKSAKHEEFTIDSLNTFNLHQIGTRVAHIASNKTNKYSNSN